MRKFAEIIESTTVAPPTNCLWIKGNDALYFTNGKWVSLFKKEDFINITDRFNKHLMSLIEAIQTVPTHQRIDGLVITFEDINGDWRIYQFRGDAVDFFDENKWTDLYDYTNYIVKSITPDEEDLTVSKPDKNGNAIVSLKDRVYDESNFSGKGYKILRKNIIEIEDENSNKVKKNILTKEMISEPNTIYEIRYDFDLNRATLELEDNIILRFDGGIIRNGVINANVLTIDAADTKIFDNIQFRGNCIYNTFHLDWFVANKNTLLTFNNPLDSTIEVQAAFNSGVRNIFLDNRYFYYISNTIVVPHYVAIDGVKQAASRTRFAAYQTPSFYTDKNKSVFRIVAQEGEDKSAISHKVQIKNIYIFINSPFTEENPREDIAAIEFQIHDTFIWGGEISPYLFSCDRQLTTSSGNPATLWFTGHTGIRVIVDNAQYFTMFSFGGTIDCFYKAFDIQINDGKSWCTSITYDTETCCAFGGNLEGSPIRIRGNHQSLVCINNAIEEKQYFTCRGEVNMTGILWDMGTRSGDYISAPIAIKTNSYVTDDFNSDNIEGNDVPLPANYGNIRVASDKLLRFYDKCSDILPLIFHRIPKSQYGNEYGDYSEAVNNYIGVLEEAKLLTSDGTESLELKDCVDNWEYLTSPTYTPLNIFTGSTNNAFYATPVIKKGIESKYNKISISWKLNTGGLLLIRYGFLKAQILWDTTIYVDKYDRNGKLVESNKYEFAPTGDSYFNANMAIKKLFIDASLYYSCVIRCEYTNIRRDYQAVVPKLSIMCNSNLNNVTINGGVVANRLRLGNVDYYDFTRNGAGLRRSAWLPSFSKRKNVVSGNNQYISEELVSFYRNYNYPVIIHCSLVSKLASQCSNILENFMVCVNANDIVLCNSKFVRVSAMKNDHNYRIMVSRIDPIASKRNNNNGNNIYIESIESEATTKLVQFDTTGASEITSINSCGLTSQRPTLQTYDFGFEYYDSSLEETIVWDGSKWLNIAKVVAGTPTYGTFSQKPSVLANLIPIGYKYFCTDKQTSEGTSNGIEIIHKGNDVWVDALGRVIS